MSTTYFEIKRESTYVAPTTLSTTSYATGWPTIAHSL